MAFYAKSTDVLAIFLLIAPLSKNFVPAAYSKTQKIYHLLTPRVSLGSYWGKNVGIKG